MRSLLIILFFIVCPCVTFGQSQVPDAFLSELLDDINHLRLEEFLENFDEDATVFFPREVFPIERVQGIEQIREGFSTFFDLVRENGDGPKYLNLSAIDPLVQLSGETVILTFHLMNGQEYHRRTLVMEQKNTVWKIIHLHASFLLPE